MSQKTNANNRQRPTKIDRDQTCARCSLAFSIIARPVTVFNGQLYLKVHRACILPTDQEATEQGR
jgi:hypothetical protein